MNTKRRGNGALTMLAILAALAALPGCFFRVGHDGDLGGDHHEEHRDGERHEGGR